MIHTLINCTCKIDLVSLYSLLLWYHSILKVQLFSLAWLPWFSDLSTPYGACMKRRGGKIYIRSQSLSSESAVKYPHIGRRKVQISYPPGEQDQSNVLPQGQQRQSNPHAMSWLPHPLPSRLYNDRCRKWFAQDPRELFEINIHEEGKCHQTLN